MKFYVKQHKYYCGVDLHARSMYVCIIDEKGAIVKQITWSPDRMSFYVLLSHTVRKPSEKAIGESHRRKPSEKAIGESHRGQA